MFSNNLIFVSRFSGYKNVILDINAKADFVFDSFYVSRSKSILV